MEREFYTIYQFAELLQVNPMTIRRAIKSGKIRAFRLNSGSKSSWRIHKSEIERMAEFDLKDIIENLIQQKKKE